MADEIRKISVTAEVSQAVRALTKVSTEIRDMTSLLGQSDSQLRATERRIDAYGKAADKAILAISKLNAEVRAQAQVIKQYEGALKRGSAAQERANESLTAAQALIAELKTRIKDLSHDNGILARKVGQLENQVESSAAAFRKLDDTLKEGDAGLLRFGDQALITLSQLKRLEVQMDAITGKQLQGLTIPNQLGGRAKDGMAGFIRNPDVNAIAKMNLEELQQISQAYELQSQDLRSVVNREIANRAATARYGVSVDQLEYSNALRYQLYDIAGTLAIVGAGLTLASTGVFRLGIAWEKNFANVVRTSGVTGNAVQQLGDDFLELQSTIPVTAEDLAEIGTLGAQMGVAAANLAAFTQTTAQFSAASGIGVDEAATALSRLDELLPDVEGNYNRLASAVLKTGVNAVATEQQIVRGTNQIASIAQVAGLTTPEIIGLSSALSSLGFSPELQRSIVTSSFSRILSATTEVTEKTERFGAVLNMTGLQFQQAFRSDAVGTYSRLLEAIASRGDAVSVLQDLELASQRLTPNLLKIGQNTDLLDQTLRDTSIGWTEQTELTRQYGIIADTVSAKLQVMSQAWDALLVQVDESGLVFGGAIDVITDVLRALRQAAKSPIVKFLVNFVSVVGTVLGVMALVGTAVALATAGSIAWMNATIGLDSALAAKTALMATDTAATTTNAAATAANTVATNAGTAAHAAHVVMLGKRAQALVGFSAAMLAGLVPVAIWTAGILAAGAAVGGLAVLAATAPDWTIDLDRMFSGSTEGADALDYSVSRIQHAQEELQKIMDAPPRDLVRTESSLDGVLALRGKDWESEQAALMRDLEDTILGFSTAEEQVSALNYVSQKLGISQEDLLEQFPDLASGLGDGALAAAEAAEQTERLATATEQWAALLNVNNLGTTIDAAGVTELTEAFNSGASGAFDFAAALKEAYAVDDNGKITGGGLTGFATGLNKDVKDFQKFTSSLTELTQRGGFSLATLFAAEGPSAMQALTDALKLTPEQLSQLESQMSLAAFYASEAFASIFAENNAILKEVYVQSGGDPAAVAAYNDALNKAMREGAGISSETLAALNSEFGITISADILPLMDPETYNEQVAQLQAVANSKPITIPVDIPGLSGPATQSGQGYLVEEGGNAIVLNVDPKTEEGAKVVQAWRDNEYEVPLAMQIYVETGPAIEKLLSFRRSMMAILAGRQVPAWVRDGASGVTAGGTPFFRDGGVVTNLPKFATGGGYGQFRGPGTGTSDSIVARVSNGEYINTAASVRYYGSQLFDDLNRMRVPKFAVGGEVGGAGSLSGGGANVNVEVNQYYPTTQDPIRKLKEDAEAVVAGIWT